MSDMVPMTPDEAAQGDPAGTGELSPAEIDDILSGRGVARPEPVRETAADEGEEESPEPEPEEPSQEAPVGDEPPGSPAIEEPPPADALGAAMEEIEQRHAIERAKWDARYEKLQVHASRLASRIGQLEKNGTPARRQEAVDYGSDATASDVETLRAELAEFRNEVNAKAVFDAIMDEAARAPRVDDIAEDIPKAREKYAADIEELHGISDPKLARMAARAVIKEIIAEARDIRWNRMQQDARAKSADQAAQLKAAKRAAEVPASTARAPRQNRASTDPERMPKAKLAALIDEKARRGELFGR